GGVMMRRNVVLYAFLAALVPFSGCWCHARRPRAKTELTPAERGVLSAFTQGMVSRESAVRIVFEDPVAEPNQLHQPLKPSPVSLDPPVEGLTTWTSPSELEFRPADNLTPGQTYTVSADLKALLPEKPGLGKFQFSFAVLKQDLDLELDGLESVEGTDSKNDRLTGKLVTADVDEPSKIEAVLKAAQSGKDLKIEWTHDADRRTHLFRVGGIVRAEEPTKLKVSWDGNAIGAEKKDERELTVPGLNNFTVDQARAVQDKESYIELRFTDPLQK